MSRGAIREYVKSIYLLALLALVSRSYKKNQRLPTGLRPGLYELKLSAHRMRISA